MFSPNARRLAIAIAAICIPSLATAAGGNVKSVSVAPQSVQAGDNVNVTITVGDGSVNVLCNAGFSVKDAAGAVVASNPSIKMQSDTNLATATRSFKVDKAGNYTVEAHIGTPSGTATSCQGKATTALVVNAKPASLQINPTIIATTLVCPGGYEKVFDIFEKGEIKCRKLPVPCPAHFDGSVDSATGKLVCTPKPVTCPEGWTGGMQGGILNCTSAPQPVLPCPAQTAQWKWGSSYYKEGWRFMGCSANVEPPK
ncbi:MAG: hypothetical protein JNM76_02495 [Betaproteobacteria bacterium]|nr:hypothetical protein [Betaproteobacteria bacterium]